MITADAYAILLSLQESRSPRLSPEHLSYFRDRKLAHSMALFQYNDLLTLLAERAELFDRLKAYHEELGDLSCREVPPSATGETPAGPQHEYNLARGRYRTVTEQVNWLLRWSQAWRAWGIPNPGDYDGRFLIPTSCWPNDYKGLFNYSKWFSRAVELYRRTDNDECISISADGYLVLRGIEAASLAGDRGFDFDIVLALVRPIVSVSKLRSVDWSGIDPRASLTRIRDLQSAGTRYRIEFEPAHSRSSGGTGTGSGAALQQVEQRFAIIG